jgi:hypothetical protein
LRDVQHDKEEVKLAHGCVLKNNEGCDVLLNALAYLIIIEVDGGIPETFELLLLPVELDWSEKVLGILAHVALVLSCALWLARLKHGE